MDPLSITASALTCVAACGQTSKLIKRCANLRNVPRVLGQLNEEVLALHYVVDEIGDVL